ncbi:hypothetical protein HYC85_021852 [Camellia sinensis]|uniref:Prephenate dehydratase domain-containing protein n=1 Tax=Camellia sinensis TaxID=4442 RepID=A0A7J7GKB9_CAMSI|nr:hypothetical protein HYC85_021852 [Camellia sinensis]
MDAHTCFNHADNKPHSSGLTVPVLLGVGDQLRWQPAHAYTHGSHIFLGGSLSSAPLFPGSALCEATVGMGWPIRIVVLHISGEVKLAIRHCLLANHGIKVQDLRQVLLSHPQFVAFHKLNDIGAVASSTATRIYGMNILAEDIQDDSDNVTQFLVLAREPIIPGTDRLFKEIATFLRVLGSYPADISMSRMNVEALDFVITQGS